MLWVAEGVEDILDEADPHLDLQNFFPCPKPAYGTVQRGSLIPVPDVLQYKDQLEEINLLTGRIHALSDAIEAKGFYPAGGAELADAVQAAVQTKTSGRLLVPISNWAAFGGTKDVIIWLPIDMIATTITALVALRKASDRGHLPDHGPVRHHARRRRTRTRRSARSSSKRNTALRVSGQAAGDGAASRAIWSRSPREIITERFDPVTIIEMSQTQLPTQAMQQQKMQQIAAGHSSRAQQMMAARPQQQDPGAERSRCRP